MNEHPARVQEGAACKVLAINFTGTTSQQDPNKKTASRTFSHFPYMSTPCSPSHPLCVPLDTWLTSLLPSSQSWGGGIYFLARCHHALVSLLSSAPMGDGHAAKPESELSQELAIREAVNSEGERLGRGPSGVMMGTLLGGDFVSLLLPGWLHADWWWGQDLRWGGAWSSQTPTLLPE